MKKTAVYLAVLLASCSAMAAEPRQASKDTDLMKWTPLSGESLTPFSSKTPQPDPVQLLDVEKPLSEREKAFANYKTWADGGDVPSQYVVGTIYRIGQQLPASPVPSDPVKAEYYLSRAAAHGAIMAMAKMAELKLNTGHYLEAMTWAQIYAHYVNLLPAGDRPSSGYLAELLERINEKFDRAELPLVVDNLNNFIDNYDASIKRELGTSQMRNSSIDIHPVSPRNHQYMPGTTNPTFANLAPKAGFAEFLISFKADGSAGKTWVLDSIPDARLAKSISSEVSQYRINPASPSQRDVPRYGWLPVIFDDNRYTLRNEH